MKVTMFTNETKEEIAKKISKLTGLPVEEIEVKKTYVSGIKGYEPKIASKNNLEL